MADFREADSLGARVQAARKMRGMRTTRELADAIVGGNVTASIIENIEVGRKVNLDISQLLNIAMALRVPPSYLLAPLGRPDAQVDLPNLSEAFSKMTVAEFDSWLSNTPDSGYRPATMGERNASSELNALRGLSALRGEEKRLLVASELESEISPKPTGLAEIQLSSVRDQIVELESYLRSAGWNL